MPTSVSPADIVGAPPVKSADAEQVVAPAASTETAEKKSNSVMKDIPVEPVRPRRTNGASISTSRLPSRMNNKRGGRFSGVVDERMIPDADAHTEMVTGILDTSPDGHGVLRINFSPSEGDAYISSSQIRRFRLRPGDVISGPARAPKENERYWGLLKVEIVNGKPADEVGDRIKFHTLTPVYP